MTSRIRIGPRSDGGCGTWISAGSNYIKAERLYCREEETLYYLCPDDHPEKEKFRQAVLDKRQEFYRRRMELYHK